MQTSKDKAFQEDVQIPHCKIKETLLIRDLNPTLNEKRDWWNTSKKWSALLLLISRLNCEPESTVRVWGTPGGYSGYFWVGVCRRNSKTLTLYYTMFSCILWPYSRLDVKNPYPIQDLLVSRNLISLAVSCLYYGKWCPILDQNSLIYIPYPQKNCSKTLPFTAAHTYIPYNYLRVPPWGGDCAPPFAFTFTTIIQVTGHMAVYPMPD